MAKKQIQISNYRFQLFQEHKKQHMPIFMKIWQQTNFFWGLLLEFFVRKLRVDMYLIC
jgi:hypothetical protein